MDIINPSSGLVMGSIPVAGAKKAIAHFRAMAFLVLATNRPISKMLAFWIGFAFLTKAVVSSLA